MLKEGRAKHDDPVLQKRLSRIRHLRGIGKTIPEVARALHRTENEIRWLNQRYDINRWTSEHRVMLLEIAAEFDIPTVRVAQAAREVLGIEPNKYANQTLTVTTPEAKLLRNHFRGLQVARDTWLTPEEAATVIGVKYVSLQAAVKRESAWTEPLVRRKVPSNTKWGYRYEPRSVREARDLRRAV